MSKRLMVCIVALIVWIVSIGAERNEPRQETINFEQAGFQKINVTAYCVGHHTATGVPVHYGCMAVSKEHLGDIALLYTIDGEYIDIFEGNDQGGTDAIREGRVVDIYFPSYEQCREFMARTGGVAYIQFVSGKG